MLDFVIVGVTVLGVGGAFYAAATFSRRRKERLEAHRELATRLGWGFRDEVPFESIAGLDRLELFRQGRSRSLSNIITSPAGDPRIVVFDYKYVTGGGNSTQVHRQTVCYITGDRLGLPAFSVRPEHFFHRVAAAFGYNDIDLEHRPGFSHAFLLRGEDVAAVRAAFSDDVVDFFDHREGSCAAGAGRELLFWRPGTKLQAAERQALIDDGVDLASRFTTRTSDRS